MVTNRTAQHSSSFGREIVFAGATLILNATKETFVKGEKYTHRNTQAAYA